MSAPPATPAKRLRAPTRDRIIEATYECFERFGIQKTTITDITSAAGLTRRTVYKYFSNKDEIVSEIAALEYLKANQEIIHAIRRTDSVGEALAECLVTAATLADRKHFLREISQSISPPSLSYDPDSEMHAMQKQSWRQLLDAILRKGDLATDLDHDQVVSWLTFSLAVLYIKNARPGARRPALKAFAGRFLAEPLLARHETAGRRIDALPAPKMGKPTPARIVLSAQDAEPLRTSPAEEAILQRAAECFAKEGVRATTVARIAELAGLSSRTVYRYFKTRDEIVEKVTIREAVQVRRRITDELAGCARFDEALTEWFLRLARISDENVHLTTLMETSDRTRGEVAADLKRTVGELLWAPLLETETARAALAPGLSVEDAAAWLHLAQSVLHAKVELKQVGDPRLRYFIRRFIVAPILA